MRVAILHHDFEWTEQVFKKLFEQQGCEVTTADVRSATIDDLLIMSPDVVLNRVYASVANRDLVSTHTTIALLAALESRGIQTINSANATRSDYDKFFAYEQMRTNGVLTPTTQEVHNLLEIDDSLINDFPIIIKRTTGGRGVGVSLINDSSEIADYVRRAEQSRYDGSYLIQEFVHSNQPFDYRITIIDGEPVFSYGRTLISTGSEKPWLASVSLGSRRIPIFSKRDLENAQEATINATRAIGAFYNSVDVVSTQEGMVVIENNPTPNYTSQGSPEQLRENTQMISQIVAATMKAVSQGRPSTIYSTTLLRG